MSPVVRLLSVLLLIAASRASAQLEVGIALERINYVAYEPLHATVTVTNNSGNDVVLGGPNNTTWLNFLITYDNGRAATAIGNPDVQAMICRNGQSIQRRFNLPNYFHLTDSGTYIVKASAYFPDLQRWIPSRPARFSIYQASRPKWERSFALPRGHRMAGKYRRYQIFNFFDTDRPYVYVRILDESTEMVLFTHRLSSLVPGREVQPAVDSSQVLHLLCLGSPQVWLYMTVDPDGKIGEPRYYRQGKGQPQLVTLPDGEVLIRGGYTYDPTEKPAAAPGDTAIRRLSDRPPGVPLR
jgi:hypothetical protein